MWCDEGSEMQLKEVSGFEFVVYGWKNCIVQKQQVSFESSNTSAHSVICKV